MQRKYKGRPPRLPVVFAQRESPLYYITVNTLHRVELLDNEVIYDAFVSYAEKNAAVGRAIGKFVIMPNHIHFFACISENDQLKTFVRLMKQNLAVALKKSTGNVLKWQPGFFDHLIRNSESYSQKWNYVHENPVRAELVESADDWSWQGEVVKISRS